MLVEPEHSAANALLRERSVTAVLDALRETPRRSRAELAAQTGLSKPTVGAALRVLQRGGLIRERGRTTGRRGPSASLYEAVADAALVLGIDIGAYRVRAVLSDLEGAPQREVELELEQPDREHVLSAIETITASLGTRRTELAVVGSPGVVDPSTRRVRSCPQVDGWEGIEAESVLAQLLGVSTIVENDVNLAALGELAVGAGQGNRSFAYLSVGSGVGAGLILDGRLFRGRHGAAGEVGYLAVGANPIDDATHSVGAMELRLSHDAIVRYALAVDPQAPDDPPELFARARAGDPLGRRVVTETARALAICIASINAVVDLDLVLIGGGIGSQADLLLDPTRTALATLVPYPPKIISGALGPYATLRGAIALGSERARASVVARSLNSASSGLTAESSS